MPSLVSVADLRTHVQTDLADAAVQRLLDDADELIVERYGPHAGPLAIDGDAGAGNLYFLPRRVAAVTAVTEYVNRADAVGVALDPTDYRLLYGGLVLERLSTGPNAASSWGERLAITATSTSTARRARVEIDLVRLAVTYEAKKEERIGDFTAVHEDYERERARLVRSLGSPIGIH